MSKVMAQFVEFYYIQSSWKRKNRSVKVKMSFA